MTMEQPKDEDGKQDAPSASAEAKKESKPEEKKEEPAADEKKEELKEEEKKEANTDAKKEEPKAEEKKEEPKEEKKEESKPEAEKEERKEEEKESSKSDEKKEEPKPETKEEPKEEKKEEPKAEAKKEESKPEAKEERKEEKKEEPKPEEKKEDPKKEHGQHGHPGHSHGHKSEHKPHHTVHHKKEKMNHWKVATAILAIAFIIMLFSQYMGGSDVESAPTESLSAPSPSEAPVAPADTGAPQLADTGGDEEVTLTVVNDPNCAACDTGQVLGVLTGQLFPKTNVVTIDFDSDEGAALIEKYDIGVLPSYIYDSGLRDNANFNQVVEALIEKDGVFILHPAVTGAGKYLNPPDADDDPVLGDEDAPVTIIEFSDFQCPFCKRFYDETFDRIKEEYVRTGKVKIVYRDFPLDFNPDAQKAAEAGECADDQGQFWAMHDMIFDNQENIKVDDLKGYAEDLGLDTEEFNDCLDSGKHTEEVKADLNDGATGGVSGTPAFFIDGELISGAQPFEVFKAVIDAALEE